MSADLHTLVLAYLDAVDAYERLIRRVMPNCAIVKHDDNCSACKAVRDLRFNRDQADRALRDAVGR